MREFSDFISEQSLIDLPLEGGSFTWSNLQEVESKARLDSFLLTGVSCVGVMGNRRTTCFFIVEKLLSWEIGRAHV